MCVVKVENTSYKAESLYQWDKNQVLQIYGISVPDTFEVHIGNAVIDKAIICNATMNDEGVISVEIPNLLLEYPCTITAYVCLYEKEAFKTVYKIDIPVIKRYKPVNFLPDTDNQYDAGAELKEIKSQISEIITAIGLITNELKGIRMDVYGNLYPTAGEAVNTQIRDIYDRLGGMVLLKISKADFDALENKDPNTIYYVDDNDKIKQYIGDAKLSSGSIAGVTTIIADGTSNYTAGVTVMREEETI